jgi:acyl-coenzyme A thioesterase PaaI-like protein
MVTPVEEPSLYIPDGDGFVGTHLIQGGWTPDEANGAMVLALLGHCLEDVPSLVPMTLSRLTADLMRPVPLGKRLQVSSSIVREGKKIQVVEMLLTVDDVVHVRASVLRLREADLSDLDVPPSTSDARPGDALAARDESRTVGDGIPVLPGFMHAVDMRRPSIIGGTGHGTWLRLVAPVVAGEPIRATSRLVVGFDFANLIGVEGHPDVVTMINPDVTGHVLRPPVGEWVGITGETRFNPAMGRGLSWANLSDDDGVFAVVSISQLIQPR